MIGAIGSVFYMMSKTGAGIFLTFDEGVYLNFDFYNKVFMLPNFHFVAHLYGVLSCTWFVSYVRDKATNTAEPAFATRMFTFVRNNASFRYTLYLIGATIMSLCVFGLHDYIKTNSWGRGLQFFYAAFAYPGYALGASLFLLPALTGRAEFVRFFLGGEIWTMFRSLAYGLHMFSPLYSLQYFLSMSNSQHVDYQMMFYNFCGILIFSLIFTEVLYIFCDRPFAALLGFPHDLKMVSTLATTNPETAFNIENYRLKGQGDPLSGEYRYIEK